MKCARVQDHLVLYLAGELGPKETERLLAHLESCAVCTAMAEELAATQERVATSWHGDIEPPPSLDARVMASVRALPASRSHWPGIVSHWGRRPRFAFVAAGLALAILGFIGFIMGRRWPAAPGLEMAHLGDAYNRMLAAPPDTELRDADPQHLAQQLTPLMRFPVRAVDLQPEGVRLVGGSRTKVDSVPMVTLHYDWQGKQISLFEMEGATRTPLPLQRLGHDADTYYVRKVGNTAYVAWHAGKTDCVMVAQSVPMHQLFHFACRACEKQERL